MSFARTAFAFIVALAVATAASAAFYTQQVVAKQAAYGAVYTPAQQFETLIANYKGLVFGPMPSLGAVLGVALFVGFLVAAGLKRILRPLAPAAYPLAGAAAFVAALFAIETFVFEGVGAIGGARDALGLGLQGVAGALGGATFALLAPRRA